MPVRDPTAIPGLPAFTHAHTLAAAFGGAWPAGMRRSSRAEDEQDELLEEQGFGARAASIRPAAVMPKAPPEWQPPTDPSGPSAPPEFTPPRDPGPGLLHFSHHYPKRPQPAVQHVHVLQKDAT